MHFLTFIKKSEIMKHFSFELKKNLDESYFRAYLLNAKIAITADNGPVEFKFIEYMINTKQNDYTGILERYNILKNGNVIGYLEAFMDNSFNYISIHTTPLVKVKST